MPTENASPNVSPEERMVAVLEREEKGAEPQEEQEKPDRYEGKAEDEESAEDAPEEQEQEGEPEEQKEPEPERKLKITHNSQEYELSEKEVVELAQKGYDYTQKTQAVAQERARYENLKQQEVEFQRQVEIQNQLIQEFAKAEALDQQLAQYQAVDWIAMSNADPVEAQKLFFSYNQLQVQRGKVGAEISKRQQEVVQAQQSATASRVQVGNAILAKDIPGWGKELGLELLNLCKDYGATDAELSKVTEPWIVKALYDAKQWKKLQTTKPLVDKKVASASPMVKPGAKDTKNAANSKDKFNRDQLRKTGKSEFAAQLIERML